MGRAIRLRSDYCASNLRVLARQSVDANQTRRLLALAQIYEGCSRTEAARIGGVGVQILHDWVVKFNERGPEGLLNGKAPGKPSLLNDAHRAALARIVEKGPTPYLHNVVRWRLSDLATWLFEEFGLKVSSDTVGRELRAMRYGKLSTRPRSVRQEPGRLDTFKKRLPPVSRRLPSTLKSAAK